MAERTSSWPGRHIATTYPSAMWHVPEGAAQANRNTSSSWMPTVAAIQQSVFNFLFLAQSALFLAQLFLNFSLHFPTQFRIRLCFPYVTRTWHQQRVALFPAFLSSFCPLSIFISLKFCHCRATRHKFVASFQFIYFYCQPKSNTQSGQKSFAVRATPYK